MSQKSDLHPVSLQYQVRTSKAGYREIGRLLPLLGELQNAAIRHRRILAKARIPNKEILRLQNASITDLRQHDPDFANIARRLAESVVKRVNDSYHRAFTVHGAGFPRTESPYSFRTLEISEPANKHIKFRKSGVAEIHVKGLPVLCQSQFQGRPPHQRSGTAQGHQNHPARQSADRNAGVPVP